MEQSLKVVQDPYVIARVGTHMEESLILLAGKLSRARKSQPFSETAFCTNCSRKLLLSSQTGKRCRFCDVGTVVAWSREVALNKIRAELDRGGQLFVAMTRHPSGPEIAGFTIARECPIKWLNNTVGGQVMQAVVRACGRSESYLLIHYLVIVDRYWDSDLALDLIIRAARHHQRTRTPTLISVPEDSSYSRMVGRAGLEVCHRFSHGKSVLMAASVPSQ